jgi:DNA (cytosine-5)-methyltransferase 1
MSETLLTQATCRSMGIASPFLTTARTNNVAKSGDNPLPTITTLRNMQGVIAPAFVGTVHTQTNGSYTYDGSGALPTQTTCQDLALLGFISPSGRNADPTSLTEEIGTFATREHHGVVGISTSFLFPVNRDGNRHMEMGDTLVTQTASIEHGLVTPSFIAEMHGTSKAAPLTDPLMCIATGNHHALIRPEAVEAYCAATGQPRNLDDLQRQLDALTVEDLTFRMLKPHEIQAGMAFPKEYIVLGNSTEKIKQLGNAVTPPVMQMLVGRCIASLEAA